MELYQFNALVAFACYTLFLFGAVKLNNKSQSKGHMVLALGFGLLVISSLSQIAQIFKVIEINYQPYFEESWSIGRDWKRWHKWFYWGRFCTEISGMLLALIGFLLSARDIYQSIKSQQYQRP